MSASDRFQWLSEAQKSVLINLRIAVKDILSNRLLAYYTDHSIDHSDRMVTIVDHLISPIQNSSTGLCDEELIILYASCYLHDVGVHFDKPYETSVIQRELDKISSNDSGVAEAIPDYQKAWMLLWGRGEGQCLQRRLHHLISADYVRMSADISQRRPGQDWRLVELQSEHLLNLASYIASACASHGIDVNSPDYAKVTRSTTHRMQLVCGLLRMADILDADRDRATAAQRESLNMSDESAIHWFRHWYCEKVHYDTSLPGGIGIILRFDFPPSRREDYDRIIAKPLESYIKDEYMRQEDVLAHTGIHLHISVDSEPNEYSVATLLEQNIYEVLNKAAQQVRENIDLVEVGLDRHQELQDVGQDSSNKLIKYQEEAREQLRSLQERLASNEMAVSDYMQNVRRLSEDLCHRGSRRYAWTLLYSSYNKYSNDLPIDERLQIGIALAEMMNSDGSSNMAQMVLREFGDLIAQQEDSAISFRYYIRSGHSFADLGQVKQAIDMLNRASTYAEANDQTNLINAEIGELYLLQGDLPSAIASTTELACTRQVLVTARAQAMLGRMDEALARLETTIEEHVEESTGSRDWLLLSLLKAELCFLNGDFVGAEAVFTDILLPHIAAYSPADALIVADNDNFVRRSSLSEGSIEEFYAIVDQLRTVGEQLWNRQALNNADSEYLAGKYQEALVGYWGQLYYTYHNAPWRYQGTVNERIARAYLKLKHYSLGLYHACLAQNGKLIEEIAQELVKSCHIEQIRAAVSQLLTSSNLALHAMHAATALATIGDVIPDDLIGLVFQWLCPQISLDPKDWTDVDRFREPLKALATIAPRMSSDQAWSIIDAVTNHPSWHETRVYRKEMIKLVDACCANVAEDKLYEIASRSLSLATTNKGDIDYIEAINLIIEITGRSNGNEIVLQLVRDHLFSDENKPYNNILVQIAPAFGFEALSAEELLPRSQSATKSIYLQVQEVDEESQIQRIPVMLQSLKPAGNKKIAVMIDPNGYHLKALTRSWSRVPEPERHELIEAMLTMIKDPSQCPTK